MEKRKLLSKSEYDAQYIKNSPGNLLTGANNGYKKYLSTHIVDLKSQYQTFTILEDEAGEYYIRQLIIQGTEVIDVVDTVSTGKAFILLELTNMMWNGLLNE